MIIGIGCDILEIDRIKKLVDRYDKKSLYRIFTPKEIDLGFSRKNNIYNFFAGRFCAKEAFGKALGIGISKGLRLRDIEIVSTSNGKPELIVYDPSLSNIKHLLPANHKIHLTISHSKDSATAFVVIEALN